MALDDRVENNSQIQTYLHTSLLLSLPLMDGTYSHVRRLHLDPWLL